VYKNIKIKPFVTAILVCFLAGCLELSDVHNSSNETTSNSPSKGIIKDIRFSKPGLPFNSLLYVKIGFLSEDNSKNGLFGNLDESQIHSVEIEGNTKGDRSVLNGEYLNFKKIYKHRITRRDHQVTIKINLLNGSTLVKTFKAKHGDVLWL